MKFNPKGLIVTATYALLLLLALETLRVRTRSVGLDAAFREIERWAEGIVQGWRRLHRQ